MYVVKAKNAADSGWTTIYDSSDKALCLISQPKNASEMNQAGSFDFTIYPDSGFYDAVVPMDTFISAFEGTDAEHLEETFYGRVLTCEDDFYGIKNVGCEGALSFLRDATVGQVSTDEHGSGREYQTSPQAFLQEQLASYNSKVEDRKKLFYGGVSGIPTSEAENFKIDDDQDFKSLLESQLIDVYGGFFKITRLPNGTHELWYVKNYGINVGTAQMIKIGQNILDKQKHVTGEGVFTFLRPVGKDGLRLDDGVYHGVACNSSNGRSGLYPVGTDEASFNALYARYGFIEKTKSFEDCENSAALANACNSYVRDYGLDALDKLPMTFDVKLVDFFNANPNVKRIELGANYILTVDSEGRETGFEGHADGTPLQDGQEGLTLTVYSVNREYENPENDNITFYNATYLTAKDYSVILSSMTGSYSGGGGGGGSRGGLSGLMASRDAEEQEQQKEEKRKVEKRFIDDEDSIGMVVTITEDGKVINAGGIWTEITGTDKTLLQGTLDVDLVALRNNAVVTAINTDTEGERSIQIDFDRVKMNSNAIIQVINDDNNPQGETQLTIDVDRLNVTGILAVAGLDAGTISSGYITSRYGIMINDGQNNGWLFSPSVSASSELRIGSAGQSQGETTGEMSFRGDNYYHVGIFMGGNAQGVPSNIVNMSVLGFSPTIRTNDQSVSLNHAHSVSMNEITEGSDSGKVRAVIGLPVAYNASDTSNRESFFDIAASQTYQHGVAAAYANAVNRVSWPTTPRTQSSFGVSVPGNPWNASTETGTTLNRIFDLSAGSFDSNHVSTVELAMSHNENGQAVVDGVVAKIDVDASGVYTDGQNSVTLSQAAPSNGFVRVSASNGEYEDVVWRTAASISSVVLSAGDAGQVVTKYPYVTYSNGDTSSSLALSVDVTAISGGSHNITIMASTRESANPGGYTEIFEDAGAYTDLRNKVDGFYTFKVSCGGTDKWYGFWVGQRG